MRVTLPLTLAALALSIAVLGPRQTILSAADAPTALTGTVRSSEEGAMEGVVVSARRTGAPFYVSVTSDAKGQFAFPRTHLEPGEYTLTMRATGYDLTDPGKVTLAAGKTTTQDLALVRTADLTKQLSSREWTLSMPGSDELKRGFIQNGLSCTYCHSVERILKGKHTAEQLVPVITRMTRYFEDGSAVPSGTGRAKATLKEKERLKGLEQQTAWFGRVSKTDMASLIAAANLSGGRTSFPYELKVLPRPKGIATKAIVTTWEIPRKDAVAHDAVVDSKGRVWYNEENAWFAGMLDPKTNTFTEYPVKPADPDEDPTIAGARDIIIDKQDNIWLPLRKGTGTALHRFEPATKVLTKVEGGSGGGGFGETDYDGKHVWIGFLRVDTKTARMDGDFRKPKNIAPGRSAGGYGFSVNTKGHPYGTDFMGGKVMGVNVEKDEITYYDTGDVNNFPRRGRIDSQDRFWFGLYGGNAINMLDTRTGKMNTWKMPTPFTTPYTATLPDKNGYIYSSSNTSERLLRLNPKTGEIVEFPMPNGPGNFDAKKMNYDPTTKKTVLLFANTRNAEIMRVELPD
ncbi:MAG: carboxypeptidase regulatory-like domain-containing protein [Vicinamibacterales bacterium]